MNTVRFLVTLSLAIQSIIVCSEEEAVKSLLDKAYDNLSANLLRWLPEIQSTIERRAVDCGASEEALAAFKKKLSTNLEKELKRSINKLREGASNTSALGRETPTELAESVLDQVTLLKKENGAEYATSIALTILWPWLRNEAQKAGFTDENIAALKLTSS